ncbi:MAG: tyrosine decarboxylase MfnA [Methanocellales archaeon]|nr:tyrosine decarboxylase MfnA [Methanocellales archaeon]MDD4897987.1 tyrosine decarboxylase MfnA [Methanocellales archaeon]MDD5446791.1 tyrosine decarboxylase MfnA [Methanocellales archaeon]
MDEKGVSEKGVLDFLCQVRAKEAPFNRVFSSMCTRPHPLAIRVHQKFIETNLGDTHLFPGTKELEDRVIAMLASLLGTQKAFGYITTGGTESNIQALRVARDLNSKRSPNVIVPASAHFSFEKAAKILGLELRKASLDKCYRVDITSVENLIDENTIALVGIAGTTEYGQIDPIAQLSEIALSKDIFLHVDAAFGGLIIPFLKEDYKFDFRLEGVSSITVDPHKMGASTIASGGLLFRGGEQMDKLMIPTYQEEKQHSLTGTRSGASVAATYAVFKHLGRRGYKRIVDMCMQLTKIAEKRAISLGASPVIEPVLNILALQVQNVDEVVSKLEKRNWYVSKTIKPKALRLIIMPHITEESLGEFLDDLEEVMNDVG